MKFINTNTMQKSSFTEQIIKKSFSILLQQISRSEILEKIQVKFILQLWRKNLFRSCQISMPVMFELSYVHLGQLIKMRKLISVSITTELDLVYNFKDNMGLDFCIQCSHLVTKDTEIVCCKLKCELILTVQS